MFYKQIHIDLIYSRIYIYLNNISDLQFNRMGRSKIAEKQEEGGEKERAFICKMAILDKTQKRMYVTITGQ